MPLGDILILAGVVGLAVAAIAAPIAAAILRRQAKKLDQTIRSEYE